MAYGFRRNLKLVIYVTLLVCFILFYLYDEVDHFIKGSTTFERTTISPESLALPSIILCMPGTKSQGKEKMGYTGIHDVAYDKEEKFKKFNLTMKELVNEISYVLNQDFELTFDIYLGDTWELSSTGINQNKDRKINVKEIWTGGSGGLCYLIEPLFELSTHESPWFALNVKPKETYESTDHPIQVFFASNNTWEGIYQYSWQFLQVPKITVPFDTAMEIMTEVSPSKILFRDGIEDVRKCIEEVIWSFNCTDICTATYLNYIDQLPYCTSYEQLSCMTSNGVFNPEKESAMGRCLRPSLAMVFKAKVVFSRPAFDPEWLTMWFKYSTGQLEVKEEVLSIGLTSFIGSVGGSLGLFLGFSMYDYISTLVENILRRLNKSY